MEQTAEHRRRRRYRRPMWNAPATGVPAIRVALALVPAWEMRAARAAAVVLRSAARPALREGTPTRRASRE